MNLRHMNFCRTISSVWKLPEVKVKHCGLVLLTQSEQKSEMRSFKSSENIHKKEGGSYYVVSANKASSVTL